MIAYVDPGAVVAFGLTVVVAAVVTGLLIVGRWLDAREAQR